jgi:predicted AlkP superfamily phosphohydrolase/phosphomutase
VLLVTAIPHRPAPPPSNGAAARARSDESPTRYPRVVVLGIDGLDPDLLRRVIADHPDRMQNFKRLADEGAGVLELGTSTPPQSPVAWSNFITGRNPGGHGIFDFLHRDPTNYGVLPGAFTATHAGSVWLPGQWQFPTSEGGDSNRSGRAFWTILGDHGVPADVWRMPINFPVEPGKGYSFPGMMTPAVDSAYGEPTLYSTNLPVELIGAPKAKSISVLRGKVDTVLYGPANAFKEGSPVATTPLTVYVDEQADAAAIQVGGRTLVLQAAGGDPAKNPRAWSDFVPVTFSMLPGGLTDLGGIVRFYLRSVSPELELYASPINVDPRNPISPVSYPDDAAAKLADDIGLYYTQGMAEDVNGLKDRLLTDAEFMAQAQLVFQERGRMLDVALDHYMAKEEGGLLFFYYSSIDLTGHMMWRHTDPQHPFHDPALAKQNSTWWSGRAGTTWEDVVTDLYLKMDPVLGKLRAAVGEDALVIVMSDHGFAPYHRKFSLNTWLLEEGYLVLKEDVSRELPEGDLNRVPVMITLAPDAQYDKVDWSRTRAYGMGFNGLYLNLKGREKRGIVEPGAEADALVRELVQKLEALRDPGNASGAFAGRRVVLAADRAQDVYSGERLAEAPEILVGYDAGYGNSDEASQGRIPHEVLTDNARPGTFNGSHLMHPSVVSGVLVTNAKLALEQPRLEDLTVELLKQYGIQPDGAMTGRPAFQ